MKKIKFQKLNRKNIKVAGKSVIGSSHLKKDIVCQDNIFLKSKENQGIVLVSDGAGSKSKSHRGSKLIVKELGDFITRNFNTLYNGEYFVVREKILKFIFGKLEKKAISLKVDIKELASTLLFVAVDKERCLYGHIGDGVIGCIKKNQLTVVSHPENGEYANQTYFLLPELKDRFRLGKGLVEDIEGFILMTDGGESSLYNSKEKKLIKANETLIKCLKNQSEGRVSKFIKKLIRERIRKNTQDDCTIGIMYIK